MLSARLACGGVLCSMGIRMWRSMRRRCWWCRSGSPPASAAAQASGLPGSASGASRAASPRIWYDSSRPYVCRWQQGSSDCVHPRAHAATGASGMATSGARGTGIEVG